MKSSVRSSLLATAHQVLATTFGYSSFRAGQLEIVSAVLARRDTLALLPTGGGKSLCFQVPGLVLGGTTLVISPLISLMQDQVQRLVSLGIAATFINSSLSQTELNGRLRSLAAGEWQFVYLAPERLNSEQVRSACQQVSIKLVVIDEAHCISEWGHDFRPAYVSIAAFINQLPHRPVVIALTATATWKTQTDIIQTLQLQQPFHYFHTFKRPNLQLMMIECATSMMKELTVVRILRQYHGLSGIIYVATRGAAEALAEWLNNFHIFHGEIKAYHGGLASHQRLAIQQDFISGQTQVIVATNAFGMGVDKPDIRFVIHWQLPATIENYIQEVGRAGRDGQPAECYLLASRQDCDLVHELNKPSITSSQAYQRHWQTKWQALQQLVFSRQCRVQQVLEYFDEVSDVCGKCDHCNPGLDLALNSERITFQRLDQLRSQLANSHRLALHQVAPISVLKWLALIRPTNSTQARTIPGAGLGWMARWWKDFEQILKDNSTTNPGQPA